jgi:hypothetical protein
LAGGAHVFFPAEMPGCVVRQMQCVDSTHPEKPLFLGGTGTHPALLRGQSTQQITKTIVILAKCKCMTIFEVLRIEKAADKMSSELLNLILKRMIESLNYQSMITLLTMLESETRTGMITTAIATGMMTTRASR